MSSFFIKSLLEETIYRIPVNSSDGFVPELMLRERLLVFLSPASKDVSHVSVHTRRLSL